MTRDELIAALEAAEGPSRKLDAEIERLRLPPAEMDRFVACVTGWVVANDASGSEFMSDSYTDSVDAALTLVPEGTHVSAQFDTPEPGSDTAASFVLSYGEKRLGAASARTPALAICIASLKARGES